MVKTIKLTPEQLEEIGVDIMDGDIVAHTRWEVIIEVVFKYKDRHYKVTRHDPATEMQCSDYIWGCDETVECVEVEKKQVMVEKWVEVE